MKRTLKFPYLSSTRSSYTAAVASAAARVGAFALGAVMLFGCPVYSGGGPVICDSQGNCCDESSGNCFVANCDFTSECPSGSTCNGEGVCVGAGYDGGGYYYDAEPGNDAGVSSDASSGHDATVDCSTTGCAAGLTCTLIGGTATCLPTPDTGSTHTPDAGGHDATSPTEAATHDAGTPDAPRDVSTLPPFTGCTSDSACVSEAGVGARCLDGVCVAEANECFDSTQCPFVGGTQEECVGGVCTPGCGNGIACPTGYSCDTSTGVCTGNPTPCGTAGDGATCAAGTTCVDQHCVPLCTTPDAAGDASGLTCSGTGLVCVDYGCIPDQSPVFVCAGADGTRSTCAESSICLHHNCYIACTISPSGDAGNSCAQADNFNVCKPVQTSSGTFDVCGSSTNLGNQCDPTEGQNCMSPAVCIDGYCR